ncbi:MAG: DNA mismatch endonuclease Vsr [Planctomycetes bacterium]|nr:DNA mismatch endonuclease Vsr [Planctomycetota bacterium]
MARIRGRDTSPERAVRSLLHRLGLRFRLGGCGLPGRPDVVLRRWRTVILVHGCFWHCHTCRRAHRPKSRLQYWKTKLARNCKRDRSTYRMLRRMGWRVVVVWECETISTEKLAGRIHREFGIPMFDAASLPRRPPRQLSG